MNRLFLALGMVGLAAAVQAQTPAPVWELPAGVVKLDGTKPFTIPAAVLGAQKDYTIEFEFRRAPAFENLPRTEGALSLASNSDTQAHSGFALNYLPPAWDLNGGVSNAIGIAVNGYWNGEAAGLDGKDFNKYSLVVKDHLASLYRNGLLLAMTGEIKPSPLPLTVGGFGWRGVNLPKGAAKPFPEPYELRAFRVYDVALAPTGYDKSSSLMRNVCGEGYSMQRADVKDPSLPRILVIGDSISMGYRGFISEHFKGKAYVDYWVGGTWFTTEAFKDGEPPPAKVWAGVLGNGPYDVVSWNAMTLHTWNGSPGRCDEKTYPGNMTRMLEHLQKTYPKTKFVWVRCTPWRTTPDKGRPTIDPVKNDPIVRLNKLTDAVMASHGVPEVDLYALCEERFDTLQEGSKDSVHWPQSVSKEMAAMICQEIENILSRK